MKLIPNLTNIIRYGGLIFIILLPYQLNGQNVGSAPVISLILPSSKDTLNNSGINLVRAEIVSRVSSPSIRIFCKNLSEVLEYEIKPEQKDSITYIVQNQLPLQAGINTIYVEAKNAFGTSSSEKRNIICQRGPFIKWLLPATAISTTSAEYGMVIIKAEIMTEYDLKNASINLNNELFAVEKGDITQLNNDTYILEKAIQLDKPKKYNIFITASNNKGETRSTTRIVNYLSGSPPDITLVSPSTTDSLIYIDIALLNAEIVSRTPLQTVRIFRKSLKEVIENTVKPEQKDSITYVIKSNISLQSGMNTIYIEARNNFGTKSSEKRSIICQSGPSVKWYLPASVSSNAESGILDIKAEIKSGFDLKNVSINLNGTALGGEKAPTTRLNNDTYILETTINLEYGKNNIFITASNIKEEIISSTRIVNYFSGSPLVITLVSPSSTDTLNNSGIVLTEAEIISRAPLQTFRIFCNRQIVESENTTKPGQKDSITYIIKGRVPLQAGTNTIYVEAKNNIGTASSERRKITCQLEPIINWIIPISVNSTTGSRLLNIKAEMLTYFDLLNANINLNGTLLAGEKSGITRINNNTYIFEKTVPLNEGKNTISLVADNARGKGYSKKQYINYSPNIISEIKWVVPGEIKSDAYRSEFFISANIITNSKIRTTHLYQNGSESISRDRIKITPKNPHEYLYENALILKPGSNSVDLSVITDSVTVNSEKLIITYIVPVLPELVWKNPLSDQSVVNQASLDIRMNIKSNDKLENIKLLLNDKIIEEAGLLNVRKENENYILYDTVALRPGDNKLYVVAVNSAGEATSETRNIQYVIPSKPVIKWTNPETSVFRISAKEITIRADITSATDLKDLQIFNNDRLLIGTPVIKEINKSQGEYNIEKTIALDQGKNKIYIIADNISGSSTSETRTINYSAPAEPNVKWISPLISNSVSSLSSTKIRATIESFDKLESLLVYVNGEAMQEVNQISPAGSQGEFLLEKEIDLKPGANDIYMVVTNINGTTRSETRYITNPPANPPIVTWTIPADPNIAVHSENTIVEACIKSATELKSAKIFVNGIQQVSEIIFQDALTGDCNYRFTKSVILKEGDNSIYIIAENLVGTQRSDQRLIRYETIVLEDKRLALIFGNEDYGSSGVLTNPVNDANLMEGTLKILGFDIIKSINATRNQMIEAIGDFNRRLTEYNVALFYYAGHGIQVDGQNYLIPVDAVLKEKTDCRWQAIAVNFIVEEFEKVPDKTNIVILDACRNNPFRSWVRGGDQGFRAMNPVSSTIISFATSEGSSAIDGTSKNGIFTEELVKQMLITQPISSVFINTRNQVMKRTNNAQRPQEWSMLTREFYFKK